MENVTKRHGARARVSDAQMREYFKSDLSISEIARITGYSMHTVNNRKSRLCRDAQSVDHGKIAVLRKYGYLIGLFLAFIAPVSIADAASEVTLSEPVYIRADASAEATVIGVAYGDTFITGDGAWLKTAVNGTIGYINSEYVPEGTEISETTYAVPDDMCKTWMPYQAITKRDSSQWKLQQKASTTEDGLRTVDGRYCVAVGHGFNAKVGTYLDATLENGEVIPCVVADLKKNEHTDSTNTTGLDGSTIEFLVDDDNIPEILRHYGNVSKLRKEWDTLVSSVTVYDKATDF